MARLLHFLTLTKKGLEVMQKIFSLVISIALLLSVPTLPALAGTRVKDITNFEGVRDNMLVGYGLVVGLNNTGDSLTKSVFTKESIVGMLERLGINARDNNLKTNNVAAVMVTATLPSFARQGNRIDVTVSAIGDASSLQGGTLIVTPLMGADGEVYAVGQGPVAIGGFTASGAAASVTKGTPTNGRIASGAIVEQEIPFDMKQLNPLRISLRNPDFTTARRIASVINQDLGTQAAESQDSGTVIVNLPNDYANNPVGLITRIEQLPVQPDLPAKVVIDEKSGIIVIGENVKISTVAIAQGNLTIRVTETPQVSQPNAFSQGGTTQVVNRTNVQVDEGKDAKLGIVQEGVNLQDLVTGLNALGVGPRDLISILQSIKAAGALQAEIEVM
jgi:flagellar P-ring protein precursor FlgI